nr:hypothetical protein [Clostridium sp. MT351]
MLAILPSGSAGKFLKKIWNLEKIWFDVAINSNTIAINKMIDAVWQKKKK